MIFYTSSIPSFSLPPPFPHFDKLVHFFEFGGLSALIVAGLRRAEYEFSAGMRIVVPVIFCLLYGLSDEIHQSFVEGRIFDLTDLAADIAGAAFAASMLLYLQRKKIFKGLRKQGGDNG
jgi:VanZ family protein